MSHRSYWLTSAGLALAISATLPAWAAATSASDDSHPHRGGHRQPPAEAFTACTDASDGDACTVTLHDHTLDGVCRAAPDGEDARLACLPNHPGPPPEAVSACAKLSEGDACSVQFDDRTITGTCAAGHSQEDPLACRPDSPPAPPPAN
jgi:hypothetical protein